MTRRVDIAPGDAIDAARARGQALIADGRVRLDAEVAELEARADADVSAAAGRGSDELRAEIRAGMAAG